MGPEVTTLAPLAEALSREYPQLLSSYYRWDGITASVSKGNAHFREELQIGDHGFLQMFGFRLKEGNEASAFKGPYSVVLTAEA
ncbi:UNVERIFIED_CONTAM: ABC transporter permease, partial [Salmonella enterica subsp. enterica serovar Weltevreden]